MTRKQGPFHRTEREILTDELMTLALYFLCSGKSQVGDRLKSMKLSFLNTYDLFTKKVKGLEFAFYRYKYGPFTEQLYETWEDLCWAGFLDIGCGALGSVSVTDEGKNIALDFIRQILTREENRVFFDSTLDVANVHAAKSTAELMDEIYAMCVRPIGLATEMTIENVPLGVFLIERILDKDAKSILHIEDEWLQKYDLARQLGRAVGSEAFTRAIGLQTPKMLREVQQAVLVAGQGEGRQVRLSEIKAKLGIS